MAVTPIAGLPDRPNIVGPHFDVQGEGRHFNARNVNGQQFNTGTVKGAVMAGVQSAARAQYFRKAGFGAAMRYTLGMPQLPSHMTDYLNARTHGRQQTGINPQPLHAAVQEPEA